MIENIRGGVVLYNHATGTGHHESWTAMFAKLLIERGYRVACITPNPDVLEKVLQTHGVVPSNNVYLLSVPKVIPPPKTFHQHLIAYVTSLSRLLFLSDKLASEDVESSARVWKPTLCDRWRLNAHLYATNAIDVQISSDMPWQIRIKRRFLHIFVPPVWKFLKIIRPLRINTGSRHPINLLLAADAAMASLTWKPDLLVSMYVDLWMTNATIWKRPSYQMPLPWCGIRFMPYDERFLGSEGYFLDEMFRGLCFLDEEAVSLYQKRQPKKKFGFLPDVANGKLPGYSVSLVEEMRNQANGRPIVLLCGSIEGRKNVRLFCETAFLSEMNSFFFAIIGQLDVTTVSKEEMALLNQFESTANSNTFFRNVFFQDERDMNAMIQAADIIYAVYRDFRISSNLLSKAALFDKPIVVSQKFLMGRRVQNYGIGVAVPEDDAKTLGLALQSLLTTPISIEKYLKFREKFSIPELGRRLDQFLQECIGDNS